MRKSHFATIQFPRGSVDRIDFAPAFDGKCEKDKRRFIQHFYKIDPLALPSM